MSGPTGVDDDDKLRNLWKQSRGVVDIHKENLYNNTSERPFVRQTLNKEIFSDDVPDSLGAVPPTWSGAPRQDQPDYSVENLDASFNTIFINTNNTAYGPNTTHSLAPIGYPHLTYYHQWEFKEFDTADQLSRPNGDVVATTWYIEDLSNNVIGREKSLARNTISFNKGGRGDYQQKFYIRDQTGNLVDVAELEDPYKFVFDNQTGFILIYANDALSPNWYLNSGANSVPPPTEGPLVGSFIRYTGAKGAAGGSGSGGGSSVGNINLVQVLELQNENLPYHPPFEDIGFGNFIPAKGMYYMPIANYVIASVDKTSALAMGHFTVKIKGPNYDLVFQFMASVVNGRNPTIKVLNSNLESQTDGWGNLIMYDDDANNKWRICLGFDETEKIPVGNSPSKPWTNVNPAGLPPPTWWINGGQSQQTFDYIRITLVNNNANQNNLTITPIAEGNWELSSESEFKDITLAPIHSITGLWTGQPGDLPNPLSINYTYRYKVISKLALSNIDPSGNIASDTAVNVFYKDIALAHNTKIGSWKFDTNSTNESQLAQVPPAGVGSGFWENVRTFETKYNKGDLALQGEKIQIDSKLLNIIGDVTTDGNITVDRNIETINGDIIHNTSTVIKEVNYDNNNFRTTTANTGSGGEWQTIARTESFLEVHLRRATAIFEVFDKSNTIGNTAGIPVGGVFGERDPASVDDYILFSVSWYYDTYIGQSAINGGGFHDIDSNTGTIDPPRCTINVINSRCGTNFAPSGNMGYISSLRVETNFIRDALNGNHQAVAQIQIKRHSSGTLAGNQVGEGVTDVKVRMINNNEGINSNTLNWNLVSNDFQFTVPSSQNGSHILEFPLCKYDTNTGTLTDNNRTGVVSTSTVNGDLQSTYFDKLKTGIFNSAIISGNEEGGKPRIEFDGDKIKLNFDDSKFFSQLEIGNTDTNNNIKIKCGAAYGTNSSMIDMNDFNIENAGKISNFNNSGSLQNRAYVQEIEYDLANQNLLPANNGWISIGFVGQFNQQNPPVPINSNSFRGDALVELENRTGNYHHIVKFRVQYTYGNPNIRVISNNFMSDSNARAKFKALRLAYRTLWPGLYTGCVLQFKLDSSLNTSNPGVMHMKIWQNCPEGTSSGGWKFDTRLFKHTFLSMPTIYVPDALHGKTNSQDPPPYYGTTYPNEISVNLETAGDLQQTNKLTIKNDLSVTDDISVDNDLSVGNDLSVTRFAKVEPGGSLKTDKIVRSTAGSSSSTPSIEIGSVDTGKNFTTKFLEPITLKNDLNKADAISYLDNLGDSNNNVGTILAYRNPGVTFNNIGLLFGGGVSGYNSGTSFWSEGTEHPPMHLASPTRYTHSLDMNSGSDYYTVASKIANFNPPYKLYCNGGLGIKGSVSLLNFSDKPFWNYTEKSYINSGNSVAPQASRVIKSPGMGCGSGFIRKVNLYHMRSALVCTGDTVSNSQSRNKFFITLELWLFNLGGSPLRNGVSTSAPFINGGSAYKPTSSANRRRIMKRTFVVNGPVTGPVAERKFYYPFNDELATIDNNSIPTYNPSAPENSYVDPRTDGGSKRICTQHTLDGDFSYWEGDRIQVCAFLYGNPEFSDDDDDGWKPQSVGVQPGVECRFENLTQAGYFHDSNKDPDDNNATNREKARQWRGPFNQILNTSEINSGGNNTSSMEIVHREMNSGNDDHVWMRASNNVPIIVELIGTEHTRAI